MAEKYQAIVVGAGLSGSWVAKELCDQGIKTVMIDRGPDVVHLRDYPTASSYPWEMEHRGRISEQERIENPIATQCYNYYEGSKHFFTKDAEQPYVQEKPFSWIRGYQVGGKSLLWARQVQRWSQYDFDGPIQDDFAIPWPIGYLDLAPWYDKVEEFIGVSGDYDGLETLPDGRFSRSIGMNVVEQHFKKVVGENYTDRHVIYGRCAHLTEVKDIHRQQGRGACQNRVICERGCPFGGYFSANSSTIPWAKRTGNLTIKPDNLVSQIIYDEAQKKAIGVEIIHRETRERSQILADVIFLNAGTLNTNMVLMNSKSDSFPDGLGNNNGLLGRYVAFHNYRARLVAETDQFGDRVIDGRSITNAYMPRWTNVKKLSEKFKRGYAVAFYAYRGYLENTTGVGPELLEEMTKVKNFGSWQIDAMMMGETIPKLENHVRLHPTLTDKYGIPQLVIHVDYDENDREMMENFYSEMRKMFQQAGFTNIRKIDTGQAPGLDIHHMGGVRMGQNPEESMLNMHNQLHSCKNVYVTDGSCMTSTGTQNPSLTFMALAARAANHAVENAWK